ncbi:hypothetical protein TWF788_002402 [Orbilia oligospora]|uniref:Uncharacterized protein n=1 Tax=Orbilia oligospora TaxID=2813651 RepID=A0A7C8K285_ORBOL|nr:hypothetical protein TWF788_002402 [Orbilia oligospora]
MSTPGTMLDSEPEKGSSAVGNPTPSKNLPRRIIEFRMLFAKAFTIILLILCLWALAPILIGVLESSGSNAGHHELVHEEPLSLPHQHGDGGADLIARDLREATNVVGRYAYQSIRHSKNGKPPKPDQVVPLVELVENEKTITVRASHTHPNHVPHRVPRDLESEESSVTSASHTSHPPGPVIHNAADLEDILFDVGKTKERSGGLDIVHTDLTTRTVAYLTDSSGTHFQVSTIELYHTHSNGNTPFAPEINTSPGEGNDLQALGYRPTSSVELETSFPSFENLDNIASPTASPAQIRSAVQRQETNIATPTSHRISKVAPIVIDSNNPNNIRLPGNSAYNASHGDSSYTHNHIHFSVGHDDGDGDMPGLNTTTATRTITRAPRLPQVTESIIADAFFNINRTVTHVSGPTWRQVATPRPPAPPVPTNRVVGPIETMFEPAINVTFELIPMEADDPESPFSIYWNPIATGAPTRADHISLASSWRANGGKYPSMPTRYDIVWDHRTNTTWNKTVEGTWDGWIDVYVSITTQYPAPPKTPVPAIPTSPGQPEYDPITNPDFTFGPGPNWVGPSSESSSVEAHASTPTAPKGTDLPAFPNDRTTTFPPPTDGSTASPRPSQNLKQEIDMHYPVPFFPNGPEKYKVWSEWIGYCSVIKHINLKNEPRNPLRPFGIVDGWGGDCVQNLCVRGINYYIHIDNESAVGQYWQATLMYDRNVSEAGYADILPSWKTYPQMVAENTQDLLRPEWIADCVVLLHHNGTSNWGNQFLINARKYFDPHGRRYTSGDRNTVNPPKKCRRLDMLLHIEEYHNINGFVIGDWWVTPSDEEPFYVSPSDAVITL